MEENEFLFNNVDFGEEEQSILLNENGELVDNSKSQAKEDDKIKKEKEETENNLIDENILTNSNNQEGDNNQQVSSSLPLSSIITALGEELGIEIKNEDLEKAENKGQFLRDLINSKIEEGIKNGLDDEQKEALEAIKTGVLPKEIAKTKVNQKVYASLQESQIKENTKLQEVIIKNSLLSRGFTEEESNKWIETLKKDGDEAFLKESIKAKDFMVEKEKQYEESLKQQAKFKNEELEKERLSSLDKVKNFVMSQKEVIPGMELTEAFKNDVYKSMTTSVAKDDKGNQLNEVQLKRSKNPIDWEFKLAYYTKLGLFDEKPDFSKLMKVTETKVTKGLEKLLKEGTEFLGTGKQQKQTNSSDDDFGLRFIK